jgi:hypothetical protein
MIKMGVLVVFKNQFLECSPRFPQPFCGFGWNFLGEVDGASKNFNLPCLAELEPKSL